MQLAVLYSAETQARDALAACGQAVARFLAGSAEGERAEAVASWEAGPFRKLCRRARRARDWEAALRGTDHELATVGLATAAAVRPCPVDQVPPALRRLQLAGLELDDLGGETPRGGLRVWVAPETGASLGKLCAQVGHAAHLAWMRADGPRRRAWLGEGLAVDVRLPGRGEWLAVLGAGPEVAVVDAGLTEVAPGTLTCAASWA
jgi:hypothetical protein